MPKISVETLLDLTKKSRLAEPDQIDRLYAEFLARSGVDATDSDRLADFFVEQKLLTRWQCEKLLAGKHKGFLLKNYKLLDHLGAGGMSAVYLGEHVHMHRRVAIKVLPENRISDDSSYLPRFYREARAAAALDHPNVVRAYDVDSEGRTHFLVMEYVEGRDLQNTVKQDGPLAYEQVAEYIRQAADGLAHAHEMGLVHRDIKPANLLLDLKGVVKVLDLGLARFSDEHLGSLTVAHDENVLGTADYLAPEQALNSHTADARADIYSLGCTMYFLLTGHPPFPTGTLPQRLMMHQTQEPAAVTIDRPDAPKSLIDICSRMMSKKSAARYQSAAEVRDVLAAWLAGSNRSAASSRSHDSGRLAVGAVISRDVSTSDPPRSPTAKSDRPRGAPDSPRRAKPLPMERPATANDTLAGNDRSAPTNIRNERATGSGSGDGRKLRMARPLDDGGPSEDAGILIKVDDPIARRFESESSVSSIGWRRRKKRSVMLYASAIIAGLIVVGLLIGVTLTSG